MYIYGENVFFIYCVKGLRHIKIKNFEQPIIHNLTYNIFLGSHEFHRDSIQNVHVSSGLRSLKQNHSDERETT